jgi:hypothetical protein
MLFTDFAADFLSFAASRRGSEQELEASYLPFL